MYCQLCLDESGNQFVGDESNKKEKQIFLQFIYDYLKLKKPNTVSTMLCPDCDEVLEEFQKFCERLRQQHRLKGKTFFNKVTEAENNEPIVIKTEIFDDEYFADLSFQGNVQDTNCPSSSRSNENFSNKRKTNNLPSQKLHKKHSIPKKPKILQNNTEAPQEQNKNSHLYGHQNMEVCGVEHGNLLFDNEDKVNKNLNDNVPIDVDKDLNDDELIAKYVRLNCDVCSVQKETLHELIQHFEDVHNIDTGYAVCCDKRYSLKALLLNHIKKHQYPATYIEPGDTRNFRRAGKLLKKLERKTKRLNFNVMDLHNALKTMMLGSISVSRVAKMYNIPRKTLSIKYEKLKELGGGIPNIDQIKDVPVGNAGAKVLQKEQELQLFGYLKDASKIFFGLTKLQIRKLAFQYAEACQIRTPNGWNQRGAAGEDWVCFYLERHPEILLRFSTRNCHDPYKGFNKINVTKFFWNLRTLMERYNFAAASIWNVDEIAISASPTSGCVIERIRLKKTDQLSNIERDKITAIAIAISAEGNSLPPFFTFSNNALARKTNIACSEKDVSSRVWMTEEQFFKFAQHFVEHVRPSEENPALLIIGNNESYISIKTLEYLKQNWVFVQSFPPMCSHKLQPLECGVFEAFEQNFLSSSKKWLKTNITKTNLEITDIPDLVKEILSEVLSTANINMAFEQSGVYPLNPEIFKDQDFTSTSFEVQTKVVHISKKRITNKAKYKSKNKLKKLPKNKKFFAKTNIQFTANLWSGIKPERFQNTLEINDCNTGVEKTAAVVEDGGTLLKRSRRERKENSFYDIFEKF